MALQILTAVLSRTKVARIVFQFSKLFIKKTMATEVGSTPDCIFCKIVDGKSDTEVLYQDEETVVFRDIKPASRFHVLVIPRKHIEDAKGLTASDRPLVEKLISVAKDVLSKNNENAETARLGFHWPPFRSVHHLHLHAIAPVEEMGFVGRLVFKPGSYWFASPEYVLSRLKD